VILSAIGAGDSFHAAPWMIRTMVNHTNLGKTYEDHNHVDAEIEENAAGEVDWTLVRAVGLGGNGKDVKVFGGTQSGYGMFVSRKSVAEWMVDVAAGNKGEEYERKRVIVQIDVYLLRWERGQLQSSKLCLPSCSFAALSRAGLKRPFSLSKTGSGFDGINLQRCVLGYIAEEYFAAVATPPPDGL
jgi:hypothetical protein